MTYLGSYEIPRMELFAKIASVNYFRKKLYFYMLDRVLDVPLSLSFAFLIRKTSHNSGTEHVLT